jgi:hypothetical protein
MSQLNVNTIGARTGTTVSLASGHTAEGFGGGKVLQVVQGTNSTAGSTNSTSYSDTGLTASITPSATSSKVLVILAHNLGLSRGSDGACDGRLKLLRDSTDIWGGQTLNPYVRSQAHGGALVHYWTYGTTFLDTPNTTSSTTYKTQFRSGESADTIYAATSNSTDTLTLIEIGS